MVEAVVSLSSVTLMVNQEQREASFIKDFFINIELNTFTFLDKTTITTIHVPLTGTRSLCVVSPLLSVQWFEKSEWLR